MSSENFELHLFVTRFFKDEKYADLNNEWSEVAFCRAIQSHEKNPDPGDKKSLGYPEGKKSR